MKKIRVFRWIFSAALYLIVIIIAAMLAAMLIFGMRLYCIQTGSMEPTYPVGTMIVVEKVDFAQLREGDVITFHAGKNTVVTHRLIGIDKNTQQLTTKGDNNNVADSPRGFDNVIGRVKYGVPFVGYAVLLLNTNFGRIMVCVLTVTVIGVNVIIRIWQEPDDEADEEQPHDMRENSKRERSD